MLLQVRYFIPGGHRNATIIPECERIYHYYYKVKAEDTINGKVYSNVLFTELKTIDTTYQNYHYRRLSYSKDYGIIKFYDYYPFRKINHSFTLIRSKIIK